MIGAFCAHKVSPVVVSLSPASATMSPAKASWMSSRLFACISSMRPTFSFLSFTELVTTEGGLELARIDARKGQRADERIVHDLERERREGRVILRRTRVGGDAVELEALDVLDVERARQIVDDAVEQRLDALVLERRAA